jgi:hypothetical protein
MLRTLAQESNEKMDPAIKAKQRAEVLARAQIAFPAPKMEAPVVVTPPKRVPTSTPVTGNDNRRWFWFGGVFATAAAIAVFVLFIQTQQGFNLFAPGKIAVRQLERLVIPNANASDAFELEALKSDAAGMAVDSSLTVKTNVSVSADQIKQSLQIVPAIEYDVEKINAKEFRIVPKEALAAGTVYKLTLATAINKDDGTTRNRDFSWAFQTKNDLRAISTVPADGSGSVPVNTGIEFRLTRDGWVDPTPYFTIVPPVSGKFETHGRTLVFVPDKPLETGRRYEVTLRQDFGLQGSDLKLARI